MASVVNITCKPASATRSANLKPKEHGAYAILAVPIVCALLIAGPSGVGLSVAVAAMAGFMAHEPLLVAIGHRGNRALKSAPGARARLGALLGATIGLGMFALLVGTVEVRWSLIGCAFLAAISFAIAIAGQHRTLGGQLMGVVGLSAPCLPILLTGHLPVALAIEAWLTWVMGFTATTMAVHGVIASQKRRSLNVHRATVGFLTLCVALLTALSFPFPVITLPMLGMSWYLLILPPPARHLKRVGWTLVAGTVMSAVWMILAI